MKTLAQLRDLHERGATFAIAYHNGHPKIVNAGDFDPLGETDAAWELIPAAVEALPVLLNVAKAAMAFYEVAPVMPTARLEERFKDLETALVALSRLQGGK